jgi:hypothetical protein
VENKVVKLVPKNGIVHHPVKKENHSGSLWVFLPMAFLPLGICVAIIHFYGNVKVDPHSMVVYNLINSLIIGLYGMYRWHKWIKTGQ